MDTETKATESWLDRPISSLLPRWNLEILLIAAILILAVVSRFHQVGLRVMSHDEVNHVVPSWELYRGSGYRHDPITHGPLQFHLIALSYFLLGDSDFSSRLPAALFSIAAVGVVMIAFRRYLGRAGALIAGLLFLISPYMLFYGRYARNEAFIQLFGVLTLYAILRYLEKGDRFSLYLLTLSIALHFAAKETAFIYAAQVLLFTAILFLEAIVRVPWQDVKARNRFIYLVLAALLLLGIALGLAVWNASLSKAQPAPAAVGPQPAEAIVLTPQLTGEIIAILAAIILAVMALVILVRNLGWKTIRSQRSFDLLILAGTLVLPQLSAFPVKMVGWDPLNYNLDGMMRTGGFIILMALLAAGVGLWWGGRFWLVQAAIFYGIFTVLYTTFFTNGQGFFTGLVGSLGYWLSQQAEERGSQPWYYYGLIQVPIYEYLAALGSLLAFYFGLRYRRFVSLPGNWLAKQPTEAAPEGEAAKIDGETASIPTGDQAQPLPVLTLLLYWSLTSLVAYSVAGEKMPWLTVHIALPLLLTAGWGLGYLVEIIPWKRITNIAGLLALLLLPVFLMSFASWMGAVFGNQPPFQGNTLSQLQATNSFILASVVTLLSAYGILRLLRDWRPQDILSLAAVVFFGLLAVLTARTAYRASFINYDDATEYLVYAHAASGPKEVLAQVEEISRRTTGGLDIEVAYDNDALYPYWWYFRNYPNHRWYTDKPTRDLRDVPLIIAGESTMSKMEPIVKNNFVSFEYMRLWWPNQDYFNLTWERIGSALADREMRAALFNIWLDRDYSLYARLTNNEGLKLETWQPSSRMRFYIRKDIVAHIWNYGASPAIQPAEEIDPYQAGLLALRADQTIGFTGSEPGRLQAPRGLAIAADGSIYVADSRNHRIQHFSTSGELLHVWGIYGDANTGMAAGGSFNEPWGVAVAPDGSVYVSDTWNHRIQKFTAGGQFITMWGYFGQAEAPDAFWGPRGLAVDAEGRLLVTDTGNKRVVVFDASGEYITQFGAAGVEAGRFDEPVGLALDMDGNVYIADTWNQRIQVMMPAADGLTYIPLREWEVNGWYGQSLNNKPFLTVDGQRNVYITDPEGYRVLVFDQNGNYLRGWGDYSADETGFGQPAGVAVDEDGRVWVSDAENNRLMRFTMPAGQ